MSTLISWTDETWNPIVGCSRVSPGCQNCYAATTAASPRLQQFSQYQKVRGWDGKVEFVKSQLPKPFSWRKSKKIFVCSMSDLFHPNVRDEWRDIVFAVAALNPQHTFQILTKRPEHARTYFAVGESVLRARWERAAIDYCWSIVGEQFGGLINLGLYFERTLFPLPNIWFGVTTENQDTFDRRVPLLLKIPAVVRWLSAEPLLGKIDLNLNLINKKGFLLSETAISWLVIGGESGKGYRDLDLKAMYSIVDQAIQYRIPIFIKQDSHYQSGKQGRIKDSIWNLKEFPVCFDYGVNSIKERCYSGFPCRDCQSSKTIFLEHLVDDESENSKHGTLYRCLDCGNEWDEWD